MGKVHKVSNKVDSMLDENFEYLQRIGSQVDFNNGIVVKADIDITEKTTEIQNKMLKIIKNYVEQNVSPKLSIDSRINEIGLVSINFIKVVVELEKEFNFEFDDNMLFITNYTTIKSMSDYIESKLKG